MSNGPLRVAFVGQGVYFGQCALEAPTEGLEPSYIDYRATAPPRPLIASLERLNPDVVIVFRPEIIPAGLFRGLRARTIGYLTEPLPRQANGAHHPDLLARLGWLEQVDPANFDRIISFDPLIVEVASAVLPVWQSLPLPVADSLFSAPRPRTLPPRMLFLGRSTEHREQMLAPIKARYPLIHIGHGLRGDALARVLGRCDVQLNLHNNPYPSFENRVTSALAAGQLVVSEPLSPSHGLEGGSDFLEVHTPEELLEVVDLLHRDGEAFSDVQAAGHRQANAFRASRLYPQLVRDALADIEANGTSRANSG